MLLPASKFQVCEKALVVIADTNKSVKSIFINVVLDLKIKTTPIHILNEF